ncbi:Transcriptional regulatory protein DegU [Methylobacterium crusticola]|uniref:Transcriptional regulatory protein DegU n=1 Tax=Methylobacterium crusticola TaxID=1697972 RepID=A0ABQ4QTT2_9HYPH|nr:response regulator transcription factor [Methylobacterium crusticola]GJD48587.1 Transcriptional regulatory protein DegU [Methylobacterium crusticola]
MTRRPRRPAAARQPVVALIEPRRLLRECLATWLAGAFPDHQVVALPSIEERDGVAAGLRDGDLVVLSCDPRAAPDGGMRAALRARVAPGARLVLLGDGEDPGEVVAHLSEGTCGYIPTSFSLKVATEAMRLVQAGGIFVPADCLLRRREPGEPGGPTAPVPPPRPFTTRQAAVLEQLKTGKSNKRIALALDMKESTVKVHVRNIMRRVGAANRVEAVLLALR